MEASGSSQAGLGGLEPSLYAKRNRQLKVSVSAGDWLSEAQLASLPGPLQQQQQHLKLNVLDD